MSNEHFELCKYVQSNMPKLSQTEIDEVFRILYKNKSKYTQNNNGIFVNLNWISYEILCQIRDYILFCLRSQTEINKYEMMKSLITDSMINKTKPHEKILENEILADKLEVIKQPRVSSSMRFYLLKKKFQKKMVVTQNSVNMNNLLTHEEYINAF